MTAERLSIQAAQHIDFYGRKIVLGKVYPDAKSALDGVAKEGMTILDTTSYLIQGEELVEHQQSTVRLIPTGNIPHQKVMDC